MRRHWEMFALAAVLAVLGVTTVSLAVTRRETGTPLPPHLTGPPMSSVEPSWGQPLTAAATGRSATRRTATPLPASPPVRLVIPSIGVDTTLMRLGLAADGTMTVPPGRFPAGWFTGSPTPGSKGPAVIAGHVTYNGPAVFFRLGQLHIGDTVSVRRADGRTAVFTVNAVQDYMKGTFPTAAVYGATPQPELRLITCAGGYDHTHHRYADNLVVYARLTAPR